MRRTRLLAQALVVTSLVLGSLMAALLLVACGVASGQDVPTKGCALAHHDPFDPRSIVHVLPGSPEPPYLSDPPTSGEHEVAVVARFRGRLATPLPRPLQVGLLEKGQVLVQYRPDLGEVGAGALATLTANPLVTVAPAPGLSVPAAASAWTWVLRCGDAGPRALAALRAFVAAHAGRGPEPSPPVP